MHTTYKEAVNTDKKLITGLREQGIVMLESPFSQETLKHWNELLDPLFKAQGDILRSYVSPTELCELGIWDEFWTPRVRSLVRSFMPDAVIETFDCYENKGNQSEEDMYDEVNSEWHRDIPPLPGVDSKEPMYCSIFIYLSDVKNGSGGFEIRTKDPDLALVPNEAALNVQGDIGTTFLWNRSFYHRSSMNSTNKRRRVLKLSVQHNYLENSSLASKLFSTVKVHVQGDPYLEFLLGAEHVSTHNGYLLPEVEMHDMRTTKLANANTAARTGRARDIYRRTRRLIKRKILGKSASD
jgi:hypothetical protein